MSNERSPRAVCSTTMGTSGMATSWFLLKCNRLVARQGSRYATARLHVFGWRISMSERIERELVVKASPEDVWAAVTGAGWLADEVEFDLRPGGDAQFRSEQEV